MRTALWWGAHRLSAQREENLLSLNLPEQQTNTYHVKKILNQISKPICPAPFNAPHTHPVLCDSPSSASLAAFLLQIDPSLCPAGFPTLFYFLLGQLAHTF